VYVSKRSGAGMDGPYWTAATRSGPGALHSHPVVVRARVHRAGHESRASLVPGGPGVVETSPPASATTTESVCAAGDELGLVKGQGTWEERGVATCTEDTSVVLPAAAL
jgi:hypothetical protein